jgi:PIN domain nuclease of toxin-antitoxin system
MPVFEDHKDPFDRRFVAQGLAEPLILLTGDAKLAQNGTNQSPHDNNRSNSRTLPLQA